MKGRDIYYELDKVLFELKEDIKKDPREYHPICAKEKQNAEEAIRILDIMGLKPDIHANGEIMLGLYKKDDYSISVEPLDDEEAVFISYRDFKHGKKGEELLFVESCPLYKLKSTLNNFISRNMKQNANIKTLTRTKKNL